ncbi:MAG: universal stress protein [Alicyclobacillus sp.]|nr:universal stress protein [Alicyclobacillus sp.]
MQGMERQGVELRKILLATDGTDASDLAARMAAGLLERFQTAELVALYVTPIVLPYYDFSLELDRAEMREKAIVRSVEERLRQQLPEGGQSRFTFQRFRGRPAEVISYVADQGGYDLVVVGSHGRGAVERTLIGSVSEEVIRESVVPVLVVPAKSEGAKTPIRRILFATDGSPSTSRALEMVKVLLTVYPDAEVITLYVKDRIESWFRDNLSERVKKEEDQKALQLENSVKQDWLKPWRDRVRFRTEEGKCAQVICKVAEEEGADLVVTGSHGLGRLDAMLAGSVSRAVAHRTRVPLLIAKAVGV